jgi:polygalacturonase
MMSFYFPNTDPAYIYKRAGTDTDQYLPLHETYQVIDGIVTLREVPDFNHKVTVKKSDGTPLNEVTIDTISADEYRVDYSTGVIYFNVLNEGNTLTFDSLGTGFVSFSADRVLINTNTSGTTKSIQQLVNDLDNSKTNWLVAVATYTDIATTYPSPKIGDTIQTTDDSKIYRYDGTQWIYTQEYSASALTNLQNTLNDTLKVPNEASWVSTDGQDTFTITNGNIPDVKLLTVYVGGVPQPGITLINSTTFQIPETLSAGINVYAKWFETKVPMNGNHHSTHEIGGQDEIDLTNLKGFDVNITIPFDDIGVNVKKHGATGTGSNNDTAAIQTVLDLAKTNGSVHCYIPDGVYWITKNLHLYSNTKITMGKKAVLLRKWNGGFFSNCFGTDVFPDYSGNGNIHIEGGTLDGNWAELNPTSKPTWTNVGFDGIGLARGDGFVFRDMTFLDMVGAHWFDINACKNVLIEGCIFKGYNTSYIAWGDDVSNFREVIQIAEHTYAGYSAGGVYDGTPCQNVTVRNCYFGASNNLPAMPTGVGNHGSVQDKFNTNIKVYGNTFEGLTYAGVRPFKYKDVLIENNLFLNCVDGVHISSVAPNSGSSKYGDGTLANGWVGTESGLPQAGYNHVICNNIFKGCSRYAVYCAGQMDVAIMNPARVHGIVISNNIIDPNGVTLTSIGGFSFNLVNDLLISNNVFKQGCLECIYLAYGQNVTITDNIAYDVTSEFVYTNEPDTTYQGKSFSNKISVNNNKIINCGRTGIFIQYINGFNVHENYIESPATETDNIRNGITVASTSKNGRVFNNKIRSLKSIQFTSPCTKSGNITITLNGIAINIYLSTTYYTAEDVANAVRNTSFSGYSTGGIGDTVTFESDTDTYFTIDYSANSTGADAIIGNQNAYGIQVTSSCKNVQTFNNDVEGKTGKLQNASINGFEGSYFYSPDGSRYKVSIANGGTISIVAG